MIWFLLVLFQLKHFIADYPLQTPYMLGKFKEKGWVLPLVAHCGVHFMFTSVISYWVIFAALCNSAQLMFYPTNSLLVVALIFAVALGIIDFSIHFVMDRIKASPKLLGRYNALSKEEFRVLMSGPFRDSPQITPEDLDEDRKAILRSNTYFWWSLGLDQMVHHLTDLMIVFVLTLFYYGI